jgi:hypothetical protein
LTYTESTDGLYLRAVYLLQEVYVTEEAGGGQKEARRRREGGKKEARRRPETRGRQARRGRGEPGGIPFLTFSFK